MCFQRNGRSCAAIICSRSRVATVVYRHTPTAETIKIFLMRWRTCRQPRPTVPLQSKYGDENEAATSVCEISSTRSARTETRATLRRPRPPGDPPIAGGQRSTQGSHTDRTKDESTPANIARLGSSSLEGEVGGGEVRRPYQERTKNDLKLSAVVQGEGVQTRWSGIQGSTSLGTERLVPSDPLRHNGRWVSPRCISFKQVPRTGYWTCCGTKLSYTRHCPSFDARMRQRAADCLQRREDHMARISRQHAIKIQARREGQKCLLQPSRSKQNPESKWFPDCHSPRPGACTRRPFLRQKWKDRLKHLSKASSGLAMEVEGTVGSFLDSSAISSSGGKRPIVRRDHVRSIVQLALSEARVNVFTVISAFKGLLEVAAAEHGDDASVTSAGNDSDADFKVAGEVSGGEPQYASSSSTDLVQRGCTGITRKFSRDFAVCREYHGENFGTSTIDASGSSSGGESCSGAALCVKLGALPAVLECLNVHAVDRRVEPLGIKLLRIFATDDSTREAIAGSLDVARICIARIIHFRGNDVDTSAGGPAVSRTPRSSARQRDSPGFPSSGYGKWREFSDRHVASYNEALDTDVGWKDHNVDGTCTHNLRDVPEVPQVRTMTWPTLTPIALLSHRDTPMSAGTPKAFHGPVSDATTRRTDTTHEMNVQAATEDITAVGCDPTKVVAIETGGVEIPTKKKYIMSSQVVADLASTLSVNLEDSPKCQDLVREQGGMTAVLELVRWTRPDGGDGVRLTKSCLRVLELIGMRAEGRRDLVESGCVETVILIFDIFRSHHDILTTAIRLLMLVSDISNGRSRILKAGGVRVVFAAMQRLVSKAMVQVIGTEMLQKIINQEPEARRELDSIKGGWQWLCQGTPEGDSLLRYAPGEKQISGWTASEEERVSTSEALATAELVAAEWTPYKLAAFMRTTRDHRTLEIGNLAYYHFFRVVSEAGLLPHPLEDVHGWRDRVKRYENERCIRVSNITRRRLERDRSGGHARSIMSASSLVTS